MRSLAEQWRAQRYCDLTIQIVESERNSNAAGSAGSTRANRKGSRSGRSGSAETNGGAENKPTAVVASFPVHRSVLDSAGSDRLQELLRALDENPNSTSQPILQLDRTEGAEPAALRSLLEWLYTGRFDVMGSMADASDVLRLAVRYRCFDLLEAAVIVLIDRALGRWSVGPDCWTLADDLRDLLEEEQRASSTRKKKKKNKGDDDASDDDDDYDDDCGRSKTTLHLLDRLAKEAKITVECNFDKLAEDGLVQNLSMEQLKEVLGSDDLIIGTEDELFNVVVSWVEGQDDDDDDGKSMLSGKQIGELFSLLRFGLLSESFVEDDVLEEPIFASCSAAKKALKLGRDHLEKCIQSDHTRQRVKRIGSWDELKAMPFSEEVGITKCKRDLGEDMWYGGRPGNKAVRASQVEHVSGRYDYGEEPKYERSQPTDLAGDTFRLSAAETGPYGNGSGYDDELQALDFTWCEGWSESGSGEGDVHILLPYDVLRRPSKYIVAPKKKKKKADNRLDIELEEQKRLLEQGKKGKQRAMKKRTLSSKRLN